MENKARKHACRQCKTAFSGRYCPVCGAEYEGRLTRARGGFFGGLLRFIGAAILIALLIVIVLVVLDFLPAAHDPAHATLYAINAGVRNMIPESALTFYEGLKAQAIALWDRYIGGM